MPRSAPPWQHYQQEAAALLTELGFATRVEERITSTRGVSHKVDVAARRPVAGVEILWVVECKLWRNAVSKEKVAALVGIGEDLGADRCLLMSETGFQSGAVQMAAGRNITLTSLDDLRANATTDLMTARAHQAERRLREIEQQLRDWPAGFGNAAVLRIVAAMQASGLFNDSLAAEPVAAVLASNLPEPPASWPPGLDIAEARAVAEATRDIRVAVDEAALGRWPVLILDQDERRRIAYNWRQLLGVLEPLLDQLEVCISAQKARIRELPDRRPDRLEHDGS